MPKINGFDLADRVLCVNPCEHTPDQSKHRSLVITRLEVHRPCFGDLQPCLKSSALWKLSTLKRTGF
jgi:hypothetical protein